MLLIKGTNPDSTPELQDPSEQWGTARTVWDGTWGGLGD